MAMVPVPSKAALTAILLPAWAFAQPQEPSPKPPATAPPPARLALVDLPANVREAVDITLAAWNVELLDVSAGALGPTMPETANAARSVAREHDVAAVVWLSSSENGPALWVLDGATDKVVARPLPSAPPFDDASATAVALTIKTLLRHSLVAPEVERFGASERPAPPPPAHEPMRVGLEALSGARIRPSSGGGAEPRLGLGAFWAPAVVWHRLDIGASVRVGLGTSIDSEAIAATFRDNTLSTGVRLRAVLSPVTVAPYLTGSLHLTRLDGALAVNATAVTVDRINPSVDLGARAGVPLGPLHLGVWVEGSAALRRQRYEVGGEPVLELSRIELELGVSVTLPTSQ